MKVVITNDLRIANKASLYTPQIEEVMPYIEQSMQTLSNLVSTTNSQLAQNAVDFSNHYNSQEVLYQTEDIANQKGFSFDTDIILFDGDIDNINDNLKELLLHHPLVHYALEDNAIHGYGYTFREPLEQTSMFNNIYGNLATPDRNMELFVDSSDYDFSHSDVMNIFDMMDMAIQKINDGDDITEGD